MPVVYIIKAAIKFINQWIFIKVTCIVFKWMAWPSVFSLMSGILYFQQVRNLVDHAAILGRIFYNDRVIDAAQAQTMHTRDVLLEPAKFALYERHFYLLSHD